MVEGSEQSDDAVQAFHNWRTSSDAQVSGTGGPDFETTCRYISQSKLKEHFDQERQLENLLDAVLDSTNRHAVSANYVREHYLKCFATLLCIGKGPMIHQFRQHRSLRDQRLPFRTQPENFPFTEPAIFEAFKAKQWQFCAPRLEYDMDEKFPEEDVLPIIHKEQIGEGGSAIIYKIVVDDSYNSLRPSDHAIEDHPRSYRNTFVLKTYRGPEAKEKYKAERDAHLKLRWDGKPPPHITAYYGGFSHGKLYNLILEYADHGTLEQFMRERESPSNIENSLLLWDRLFDVTHGIACIHGQIGTDGSSSQMLDGWHQDVKPANILVFSGKTESTYDVYFKIADLDLAHFKPRLSLPENDPSDFDVFGTRAYGAPETYRSRNGTESLPLKVSPGVDLWSLGCIFSEVSVWHHGGWKRVVEYRRRRSKEVESKGGGSGEHIFHFGGSVLDSVLEIHKDMADKHGTVHFATRRVLELLVPDMLLHEARSRPHAPFVLDKSKNLIKELRARFDCPETWPVSSNNEEPLGTSEPRTPRRVSPRHHPTPSQSGSGNRLSSRAEREFPPRHNSLPDDDSEDSSPSRPRLLHQRHSLSKEENNNSNNNGSDATETSKSVGHGSLGQQHGQKGQDEGTRPTLSLQELHEWKSKKKNNDKGASLPGNENLAPLYQRNHVFLVDNSKTMNEHRRAIERVISELAYVLKKTDEDGLDVYFIHSSAKINSKKSTELSNAIHQASFHGVSDMRWGLNQIMQNHPRLFYEDVQSPRRLFRRQPPPQLPRPLSVYILTDGHWQPNNNVGGLIIDLVNDMTQKRCRKEQLAIQFIRFGNDAACIERLDRLDHGLGLKAKGMDIVDHTYWEGNVWKQLLGAINDWYDDDPP